MPKLQNILNGQWFIVSEDDRTEFAGPMTEKDARAFLGLLEAVRPFATKFDAHVQNPRYSKDRRDWSEHIPGDWPLTLKITMDDGRRARTAHQAVMGEK
jgi:hypothetical protein